MKQLADGVWHLNGIALPWAINVYLADGVVIDAAGRRSGRRLMRQLEGHDVHAHALTHAHPDHQGASAELCERLGAPFWVGERDADAAEDPSLIRQRQPDLWINGFMHRTFTGPGRPVDRKLREGDDVAGFRVLDAPGHSVGHVVFWRESDRVLIVGDVLNGQDPLTGIRGLREPKTYFTPDPARNRASIRRLGQLEPSLAVFGHGPPVRDTAEFVEFCRSVPD